MLLLLLSNLVNSVVVDVNIVVVVVVDVVVGVGDGVEGEEDEGHEVEGVEAQVAHPSRTPRPREGIRKLQL